MPPFFDKNDKEKEKKDGEKKNDKKKPKLSPWQQFTSNILSIILIFLILITAFSLLSDFQKDVEEIPISQLAQEVQNENVAKVVVEGEKLTVTLADGTEQRSKKEAGTALSETLSNYGVSAEKLLALEIDVQGESGFLFWAQNILPFLIPLILIILIIWFISRQMKGAGMQAFTFGQSKARIIDPNDKSQRVVFKDVAGVKEAKEELREVVDFLRNPKKFLDIGARIPKGVLLMGAPGTGKCITGDTRLTTNKGMIRMDEVPKQFSVKSNALVEGLDVVSLDPHTTEFKTTSASHWYDLGVQDTLSLETEMGMRIEGTYEHPVVVVDENSGSLVFRRLDELKENDWLVAGYNTQKFGTYTKIPHKDVAYLMGVLVGDGCLTVRNRVTLSTADSEVLSAVQHIAQTYLGNKFTKSTSRTYDYELRDKDAKEKLVEWGMAETYAEHKGIPDWISIAPKEFVQAFLRGLFDADGYVEKQGTVGLSSSNKGLLEDVHAMLLNLGIVARVYTRKKRQNGKLQWYIVVYGDFVEAFQKEIGFTIHKKKERLDTACDRQRNTNINVIPHQESAIGEVWKTTVAHTDRHLDRAFYNQSLYKNAKRYMSGDRMPSVSGVATFIAGVSELSPAVAQKEQLVYLKKIASGGFFFTRVSGITKGKARVYDLTVPHTHNFIANGFVNHNTLLARAVAGEARVPFFHLSGAEFVEMFVGVGASRVRDLFKMAKKAAPAIVFIDEIDAVGRVRGTGMGGGNDEREQTLNQILVEMDGFEPNEKVIVMAATNRPDVLDPALLRPGRFDRRVTLELPDREDREQILGVHANKKPLGADVDLKVIAERTPGFSGADLYSLMNEAAILAAREKRKEVSQYDLIRSIEKVMLGPERRSRVISRREKEITAYHEAGHALVASVLPYSDPVHKISIIARGHAGGYTMKLPIEERRLQSRKEFLDDLAMSLGGYVAELKQFGDLTTGPSNDLQVSTALARDMVTKYGMSEDMGPVALESSTGKALVGRGTSDREYSEDVSAKIDAEVKRLMTEARTRAEKAIEEHKDLLDEIVSELMENETIERKEFEELLVKHGIKPKKAPEEKVVEQVETPKIAEEKEKRKAQGEGEIEKEQEDDIEEESEDETQK